MTPKPLAFYDTVYGFSADVTSVGAAYTIRKTDRTHIVSFWAGERPEKVGTRKDAEKAKALANEHWRALLADLMEPRK